MSRFLRLYFNILRIDVLVRYVTGWDAWNAFVFYNKRDVQLRKSKKLTTENVRK